MKTTATTRNAEGGRALSPADLAILVAVQRFGYLTAGQVSRLLYPGCHDQNRYARRRLARLADAELLLRLTRLSTPRYGSGPQVFTLGRAGRAVLAATDTYYRPGEEQAKAHNSLFMTHTLATIDVLIAAEVLCRSQPVSMPRLLTERELRARPTRVSLAGSGGTPVESVAVVPDAWFELAVDIRKPVAIAVELDRGTEDQKRWRTKVAALAGWAAGPYRQAFGADTLTVAVVTPDQVRRDTLRGWTTQELTRIGQPALAEIFLMTSADPVATAPVEFFFGRCWYEPVSGEPVSLLPPPPQPSGPAARPGKEVWSAG